MDFKKILSGKKAHITAGLMVCIGIINLISGDLTLQQLIASPDLHLVLEGMGISTLRLGIAKK